MPICLTCGCEVDDDVMTPCSQCKGEQEAGDADCWVCCGMGQQIVSYYECPGRTRADGWKAVAMMPERRTNADALPSGKPWDGKLDWDEYGDDPDGVGSRRADKGGG